MRNAEGSAPPRIAWIGQPETRGPPVGPPVQLVALLVRQRESRPTEELPGLGGREGQPVRPQLPQPVAIPGPVRGSRRRSPLPAGRAGLADRAARIAPHRRGASSFRSTVTQAASGWRRAWSASSSVLPNPAGATTRPTRGSVASTRAARAGRASRSTGTRGAVTFPRGMPAVATHPVVGSAMGGLPLVQPERGHARGHRPRPRRPSAEGRSDLFRGASRSWSGHPGRVMTPGAVLLERSRPEGGGRRGAGGDGDRPARGGGPPASV